MTEEMGAELAELYLKGKDTMPLVAGEVQGAASSVLGTTVYSAFSRSGDIGLGPTGCYAEFSSARSSLYARLNTLGDQLEACGVNIMKTAQDMADVDQVTMTAFRNHGGELPK